MFPEREPYAIHRIPVGDGHVLYAEECGTPDGLPVLFLHGGPASGCRPRHRTLFDPSLYRAILFDQRGAGRSSPYGDCGYNDTDRLIADIELLRVYFNVDRWLLFGGSWGAALALLYAEAYPQAVAGMVLRGAFLARQRDLDWFLKDGAPRIFPDAWAELQASLPHSETDNLLEHLYRFVFGEDEGLARSTTAIWQKWAGRVTLGDAFNPEYESLANVDTLGKTRIELHYAVHRYFIAENQVLDHCGRLSHIPAMIVHGRRDMVCPVEAGYSLHRALPNSELVIVPHGGHIAEGAAMSEALLIALARVRGRIAEGE